MSNERYDPLVEREVYRLRSRNLRIGVWTGSFFVGVREKFGSRYLDVEWPTVGKHLGTVQEARSLGFSVPEKITLDQSMGRVCSECGRPAEFKPDDPRTRTPGKNYYVGTDTLICGGPLGLNNSTLFNFLDRIDKFEKERDLEAVPSDRWSR